MRILYVEDDPRDADLTRRQLRKAAPHCDLELVGTQREALARLSGPDASSFDLVLTDMRLHDGDGLAILRHIRSRKLPLAVVLITGAGDEETAVAVLKSGANDYVVKRGDYLSRLQLTLEDALHHYRAEVARYSRPLRVLYAEHNTADMDLLQRHLAVHASYIHVDTVSTATEALQRLSEPGHIIDYDILLLDYRLPGLNALELLKELYQVHSLDIPVVLVTGQGDEEVALQALKLGAADYVPKNPGYLYQLPSVLENAFHCAQLTREHTALHKSESKYKTLIENIPQRIFTKDINSVYASSNARFARDLGIRPDQLVGKTDYDIFPEALADKYLADDKRIMKTGIAEDIEERFVRFGEEAWVQTLKTPIREEDGTIAGILGVFWDITERKRAETEREKLQAQLIQAQKLEAIGTLAGGIAHDFNNILSAVIGFAELAMDSVESDNPAQSDLQQVLQAGRRAQELVHQILTFSRQRDQEQKPVKIKYLAKEVLKLMRASLPTTIQIQDDIASDSPVNADPTQIHQVLMNLCTNAGHAMREEGGTLKVTLSDTVLDSDFAGRYPNLKPGPYVNLSISDTGCGMPVDVMERIFDPFFTTKADGEGTGMGLSVVHGIVKSHGGAIAVYSEPGQGTTFSLFFPTIEAQIAPENIAEEAIPSGTERILFIDDEPVLAKMGIRLLEPLGYKVTTRTSGIEAVELFRTQPERFDLVITDMTMPGLTGDKVAQGMMQIRPDLPIILCTGFSAKIDAQKAAAMGIRAFVTKPLIKRELARTIRMVLDRTEK